MKKIRENIQCNQTMANLDNQGQPSTCRICLQPCLIEHPPFCECRGHVKSIHQKCLMQWALRVEKIQDKDGNIYFYCQICKSRIYIELATNCSMRPCDKMCDSSSISTGQICSLTFTALIFFIIFGICLYFLILDGTSTFLLFLTICTGLISLVAFGVLIFKGCFSCRQYISRIRPQVQITWNTSIANSFSQF